MSSSAAPADPAPVSRPAASDNPAARVWTSLDLIQWTRAFFERKGIPSARLEAEMLLSEVLGCPRIKLYTDFEKAVPDDKLAVFRAYVKRRAEAREPLQYIVGWTEFLDLKLKVAPAVLIPRPETEELAEWAIGILKALPGECLKALDIGTGSGCLALALAAKEPRAQVTATDLAKDALGIARENAVNLKLDARVSLLEGDCFAPLPPEQKGSFDLIVSNPPYIDPAQKAALQAEVRDHEPAAALYAEEHGLAVIRKIISGAGEWLKPGGRLGLEIAPEQAGEVKALLGTAGFAEIEVRKDAQGRERMAMANRPPSPL
ncbi:MAG: peptide chain release factor N(5)-glutamine methyltransferase [Planctomycetes bacterium]|nr:peptide chain release factor N(5)-glutamine methyltransferase [Planctomycetota bacterium]